MPILQSLYTGLKFAGFGELGCEVTSNSIVCRISPLCSGMMRLSLASSNQVLLVGPESMILHSFGGANIFVLRAR